MSPLVKEIHFECSSPHQLQISIAIDCATGKEKWEITFTGVAQRGSFATYLRWTGNIVDKFMQIDLSVASHPTQAGVRPRMKKKKNVNRAHDFFPLSKNKREMQTAHRINTQLDCKPLYTHIDTHEEKVNGVHRRHNRIET